MTSFYVQRLSFTISSEDYREVNPWLPLPIEDSSGVKYLVDIKQVDFNDDGTVTIEGYGREPDDEPQE